MHFVPVCGAKTRERGRWHSHDPSSPGLNALGGAWFSHLLAGERSSVHHVVRQGERGRRRRSVPQEGKAGQPHRDPDKRKQSSQAEPSASHTTA